jgi:Protein of unknown function (DUF1566)
MNKRMMGATVLMMASALGAAWPATASAQRTDTAAGRFVAQESEVTDTLTGLVWRRCAEGQSWTGSTCAGSEAYFSWPEALDRARSVAAGGVPWRLPNIKELGSLVDDSRIIPAIDMEAFPGAPATYFWSSTHLDGNAYYAWYVNFYRGEVLYYPRYNGRAVRLVRAGQ